MTQWHPQHGLFHVTTNARGRVPWCTMPGVPQIIVDNLVMTKHLHQARLYAFCILPDHVHLILGPGERGLSSFMQSFKSHAIRDLHAVAESHGSPLRGLNLRWQKGFHDECILDDRQYGNAYWYVVHNAAHHRLVQRGDEWPWSSLQFRDGIDAMEW